MPSRPIWRGQIRLALVSIPVELFPATRSGAQIQFHQVHEPTGKRIKYEKVVPGLGPVDKDEIVKGYEVSKGHYVLLDPEEIDSVKLESRKTLDLVQFVDEDEIDATYFDKPYYLVPADDLAEEAYVVLRDALKAAKKVGVGQLAMRGQEYVVALKPCGRGLLLETLRYADEVHKSSGFFRDIGDHKPDADLLDMASMLIERKAGEFDPKEFHNRYVDALHRLIEEKQKKQGASRLHWDFRLELDGVLKSWAVPKGPSLDPGEKRLAMRTEDHPLDYGDFEGTIPAGEYGGGTVMLWDHGRWIPDPRKDPSKTIEEGHLHFTLEGERMKGEWVLFRLSPRPGEKGQPWMLKKVTDEYADPDHGDALVEEGVTSVTTGRTMAEIAAGEDVWRSNRGGQKGGRAKKKASKAPPAFEEPQLATLVDEVPPGTSWIHEYKYDGYRLELAVGDGVATAWTRNGEDWSDKFKALVKAAAKLPAGSLLDGEAVALDDDGKPSFQLLQSTLKDQKGANLVFYAFDLLIDRGEDIRKLPNIERKERLAALLKGVPPPILYGDHIVGRGEA